jgi:hypothetical protein
VTTMWVGAFCRWQKRMSGLATCTLYLPYMGGSESRERRHRTHRRGSSYPVVPGWMQEATSSAQ